MASGGAGDKRRRREWSRKPGRENGGMWTRVWFKIGDEFADVCKRAIQHWCRVAEQEGREREPLWWRWSGRKVKSLTVPALLSAWG